jgi:hypothetical protein
LWDLSGAFLVPFPFLFIQQIVNSICITGITFQGGKRKQANQVRNHGYIKEEAEENINR